MKTKIQNLLVALALTTCVTICAHAQNLFVANNTGSVAEFGTNGAGSLIASNLPSQAFGVACDSAGYVYVSYPSANTIEKFSPSGADLGPFTTNNLKYPQGVVFDSTGNLYVANSTNIEKFAPNGNGTSFASTNTIMTDPASMTIDGLGNLYVADVSGGNVVKVTPAGVISSFVNNFGNYPSGIACDAAGNVYVANYETGQIYRYSTNGTPLNNFQVNGSPTGVAFDDTGNLYVSVNDADKIEIYTTAGTYLTTFATDDLSFPQQMAFQFAPSVPFTYTTNNGAITITGYTGTNTAVTIPSTINGYPVTSIGANAFLYNSYPTNITIPSSVTSIGQTALFDCFNLISITVNPNNSFYSSVGGVLFDKSQQTLIQYPYGLTGNYTIPNGVITIGSDAFSDNPGLTSVTVPNSVTSIQVAAFFACTGLTNIIIGNSVTSIVSQAFGDCTSLQSVYFQGNAPASDPSVFQPQNNNTNAIAYYLPGTVGWGPTFDGIPTQILLAPPPALGISTYSSQPAVFFPTATGTNYVLQMTTNLTPPINWVTVTNGVPISGIIITNPPAAAFFRLH